jgi:hypothetical protein
MFQFIKTFTFKMLNVFKNSKTLNVSALSFTFKNLNVLLNVKKSDKKNT